MAGIFKFTFGPWNIHEGADPFGPVVRNTIDFDRKLEYYKELEYDAVQFHDDDAVPELNHLTPAKIAETARDLKNRLSDKGLAAEFVAPRLWEDARTIDGGYTANSEIDRKYAIERSKKAIDIANELGTDLLVLWLAREGSYIREA
ncbi:MAG TPA: TIM barrel protein, partial [Draconibacterium sp.]|nr:TIM barrel protein [Draconibacterium sp.]